jgi:hypothetical protein
MFLLQQVIHGVAEIVKVALAVTVLLAVAWPFVPVFRP